MRTIVEYTDARRPRNEYPRRIVSPTHPGPCCAADMKPIGKAYRDRGKFIYKRCTKCGYTVRCFVGLDWRWIRTQLARVTKPRASLGPEAWLDTWITYRWIR